jgi:hypothetical protein
MKFKKKFTMTIVNVIVATPIFAYAMYIIKEYQWNNLLIPLIYAVILFLGLNGGQYNISNLISKKIWTSIDAGTRLLKGRNQGNETNIERHG